MGTIVGLGLLAAGSFLAVKALQPTATPHPTVTVQPTSTPQPTVTPQPTATPQPTVTPNPNASAPAYLAAIEPRMSSLVAAFSQADTDCGAGDLAACRGDMQQAHDEVTGFQYVLAQNPAPPCLHAADTQLHRALTYYHDTATSIMRGIDSQNVAEAQAGGQLLDLDNAAFKTAATELNQAQY